MNKLRLTIGFAAMLLMPIAGCLINPAGAPASRAQPTEPSEPRAIIDMHLHADRGTSFGDWASVLRGLERHRVVAATLAIENRSQMEPREASTRFLRGPAFPCFEGLYPRMDPCFPETNGWPDLAWLRSEHEAGRLESMGEILHVYYGIPPDHPKMAPYWAFAEGRDIPVGVHVGRGPFRRKEGCCPHFNDDLGNPLLLEPVLRKHPRLRLWMMHAAGWDYIDEAIAVMKAHPNVYAELSIINSIMPQEMHADALRALLNAGLGERIMFGSDNVPYRMIIERMEALPFLSEQQKHAIYYANAARFLRLDP